MEARRQVADSKEVKKALLREINKHRSSRRKEPLEIYPDEGCCCCGEGASVVGPLIQCRMPYIRKCQNCLLERYPFSKLRILNDELITWFGHNPTFHRVSDYGIVLSSRALCLFSPFLLSFARWHRIPLEEIREVVFRDSRLFPSLRIEAIKRREVLRTPWDYEDEMAYDREILRDAVTRIHAALPSLTHSNVAT